MSWKLISVSVLMYVVALAALAVPATAQKGVLGIGADPAQGVTDSTTARATPRRRPERAR